MTDERADRIRERDTEPGETALDDDIPSRRFDQLYRTARQFVDQPTETAVYDHVIAGAYDLFDVRYAIVVVPRQDDQCVAVTSTRPEPNVPFGQPPIVSTETKAAMERNEVILVENLEETTDGVIPYENGCALCAPIGDAGMLQLVREADDDFTGADVRLAKLLGWITAVRLDQLSLRDEAESMEERITSFTDFQATIFERTAHELRTPLTTIIGYAELLAEEEEAGTLSDDQHEFVRLILRNATELDATIEMLTASFDSELTSMEPRRGSVPVDPGIDSTSLDGPFVVLALDTEVETILADQLAEHGYEVTVADDPEVARNVVRQSPSSTIVVELFATGIGDGAPEDIENGLDLAETIRSEVGSQETTIRLTSILREESVEGGGAHLGVSAYIPEESDAIVETSEDLFEAENDDRLEVLVYDSTATDESIGELPANWAVRSVTTLEDARTALEADTYDLGIVRTEGLSTRERKAVHTLRKRRAERRLPVVIVDRTSETTDVQHVLGGKLFVQRPLTVAPLATILVSSTNNTNDRSNGDK